MAITYVDLTGNIADLVGTDFDYRRTKVWIETNIEGDVIIDPTNNQIRLGDAKADVDTAGDFTFTGLVATNSTTNPTAFQYRVWIDYATRRPAGPRAQWDSGWFSLTATSDLADVTAEQYAPPTWQSTFMTDAQALLDAQIAISGIDDTDSAVAGLIEDPLVGPLTNAALSASTADSIEPGETDPQAAVDARVAAGVPAASTSTPGRVELATSAETTTGTDTARAVTPAGAAAAFAAKLAANRSLPRTVSGVGTMLVAPHRNLTDTAGVQTKRIIADETCNGIEINSYSGASGNGVYGVFGKDTTSSTWRAVMSVEEGWTGTGDDGNFPSNGFQHAGIVSRFSTSSDFAVVLMFSPASGEIQIAAKVADTETVVRRHAVTGGIAWGQKILLEISVGTTGCQCRAWDYETGTLLDDYTYTLTAGTPASGYFAFHTYSCRAKVWGVDGGPRGWDPTTFAPLFGGQGIWASNAATYAIGGPRVTTSGLIDVYSDGTNGSPNEWVSLLLPVRMKNFVLRGTVRLESGRMFGFRYFCDAHNTQGYSFTYDNNTPKISLKKGDVNGATEVKAWTLGAALTAATDYPLELTVNNDIYSLRINGATYAYRDASYSGPGYVGLCGYGSHVTYKDLTWSPDPLTAFV